jgi:predicted CXXCH cytochrome family protein
MASSSFSKPADTKAPNPPVFSAQDYVGSETCKTCHEEQFARFSKTKHSRLSELAGWKDRMQGCESCHGAGKAHVDGGGDKTKIRTFQSESSKQISESCLACHAGKEEHNNYRRGEHWRNDVGCVDCHAPHGGQPARTDAGSMTAVSTASAQNPDISTLKLLKTSQPQLCLKCHNEMKAQFSQPFHHKVLEGTMKCSDCHNPHGGFELKQARLATGADASCLKCHKDKQGPFVFEHAPLKTEGCVACHTPHGAGNPKLLKRNTIQQLCLECHSNAHEIGAPNTPSFHNQATARFQNCTTCHVKIHGSQTHEFYFR